MSEPRDRFRRACEAMITEVFASVGMDVPGSAASWSSLAGAAGPVDRCGPLTHDVLLPRTNGGAVALNVFAGARVDVLGTARRWAGEHLGIEAQRVMDALAEVADVTWNGGGAWTGEAVRLKLYATSSVSEVLAALGAPRPTTDAFAVGVDVTRDGPERIRTYHPPETTVLDGWNTRWPALSEHVSRRIVTALDGHSAHLTKRALNTIFTFGATRGVLRAVEDEAVWHVPPGLLERLDHVAANHGFALYIVAHELDVFGDGRTETDVLVAVGSPP